MMGNGEEEGKKKLENGLLSQFFLFIFYFLEIEKCTDDDDLVQSVLVYKLRNSLKIYIPHFAVNRSIFKGFLRRKI